jgi:predicted TIM-barrel fold metal-dependent hydrolase
MAKLPFVDTHLHFWNLKDPNLHYAWLQPDIVDPRLGDIDALKRQKYMAENFIAETRFQNVSKGIHVQAAIGIDDPVEETRWLQEQADATGFPHGIIGRYDFQDPDMDKMLERHLQYPNFRGCRAFSHSDDLAVDNEAWQKGLRLMSEYDLVFCVSPPSVTDMPKIRALAEKYPDVVFCIDNAGVPRQRDHDYFQLWRRGMNAIAGAPNTVVKISGLGMYDNKWTVESIRPWVEACIEAWGTDRAFFATNWPVDSLFSSYGDVVNAYEAIISGHSLGEQEAMFSRNAERIFRI